MVILNGMQSARHCWRWVRLIGTYACWGKVTRLRICAATDYARVNKNQGCAWRLTPNLLCMARLEVRSTGEAQAEIAAALLGLGLQEVEAGFFVAEGDGRALVRVLGSVTELQKGARHAASDERITINFQDAG